MKELLCDPTHLFIIIGVLLLAMILLGSGKGIGALVRPLIQKLSGKSPVTVNVGEFCELPEHLKSHAVSIDDLRAVLLEFNHGPRICLAHEGVIKDIGFVVEECKAVWLEIKDINKRQISLREKLPEQYVAKSDLANIQDRLKSIDSKLDRYMELAIKR